MIILVLTNLAISHNFHYYEQQFALLFSMSFSNSVFAPHFAMTCLSILSLHFIAKSPNAHPFYPIFLHSFQVLYRLRKHLSILSFQLIDHLAVLLSNAEIQDHNNLLTNFYPELN